MNDKTIIIDITEANKAKKYSDNGLFQIESFKKVEEILKEHSVGSNDENIVDCRFHDTIFIDGARGVGKTAFLLNIKTFYENNKNNKRYLFLDPVDPTLLEHTEKFLSVVFAKVVERVSDDIDSFNEDKSCKYFEALSNLSKSLSAIKTLSNDIGIEEIASNKSSLKLEQNAHRFFKVVSEMYGVEGIVILIDDIDMAFEKGFDVLEVVRKYLASPYLIPMVAGDMELYKEIVETQFMKKIGFHDDVQYLQSICSEDIPLRDSEEYKAKRALLDNLVEQYLHKLFPSEYHIELKDIFSILKSHEVKIHFENDLKVSFSDLEDFEIRHINFGINQAAYVFDVFTNNARELIQYIYAKKKIYQEFFKNNSKEFTYKEYETKRVMENMDEDIKNFIKKPEYKESLAITALKYKINKGKFQKLSKLTQNASNSFENEEYNIYKSFTSDFFTAFRRIDGSIIAEEKTEKKLVIESKSFNEFMRRKEHNDAKFITSLFVFNDYYTQHQTKNYLFSGKFIEMLIFSFSIKETVKIEERTAGEIVGLNDSCSFEEYRKGVVYNYDSIYSRDRKDIEIDTSGIEKNSTLFKIATKVPFNSELTKKRYLENYNDNSDDDSDDEIIVPLKTEKIYEDIAIWKRLYIPDGLNLNTLSLYKIILKFFKNYGEVKPLALKDTPLEFMKRTVLIFINAVAYFENSNLDVANTNMAVAKKFDFTNILTKTNASTKNIKPMFNQQGSLTRALFYHPLVLQILFPNENSSLDLLRFSNQKESNQKEIECLDYLKSKGYRPRIQEKKVIKILEGMMSDVKNNKISLKNCSDCSEFTKLISKQYVSDELKNYLKKILISRRF